MKKVLIITYYWPPSGGAGVQRWLKFVKYISNCGWDPIVLTVDPKYASYPQLDISLESEVPSNIPVFRTKSFEILSLYKKFKKHKELPYGGFANQANPSFLTKISRFIRGNFFIPDPRKGWNRYALEKAKEIIKEYGVKYIITTGPPHSTHLIGLKLKKTLNCSWIADFRDPWTDIYYYNELSHTYLARNMDLYLEKKVLQISNMVLVVSNRMKSLFVDKLPSLGDKIHIISNGYDDLDFNFDKLKYKKNDVFTITYTGTISDIYDVDTFIVVMKELVEVLKLKIKLRFVGKVSSSIIEKFKKSNINNYVEYIGYVEHSRSVEFLLSSDLLLLVLPKIPGNKGILTGKFFEYLAAKRPILAIAPKNGDVADIMYQTKSGTVVDYDDREAHKETILKYYNLFIDGKLFSQSINIDKYSRKELTTELVRLLNTLIE